MKKALARLEKLESLVPPPQEVQITDIFRTQLEITAKKACLRKAINLTVQEVKNQETGRLLELLGYGDSEEGREYFKDEQHAWTAVLKHEQKIPHVCSPFCPMEFQAPVGQHEFEVFTEDVRWYLGFVQRYEYRKLLKAAIRLYMYSLKRATGVSEWVLKAYDEMPDLLAQYKELSRHGLSEEEASKIVLPEDPKLSEELPSLLIAYECVKHERLQKK